MNLILVVHRLSDSAEYNYFRILDTVIVYTD